MSDIFQPAPKPRTELGRYRLLSTTAGVRCSPLQLGAMNIGDAWSAFMGSMTKEQSFKLLDEYFQSGGNFIDTACNYQNEQSETWIGEWMQQRKNRDNLVIATKFTTHYRAYAEGKETSVNYSGNSKRALHISVRDSLRKLQTEWIDILYLHWWDWTTSIPEIMDSLHILVQQGKVLYLGISDSPAWVVSAANEYAKAHAKTQFSVYQGRWNVMVRDFERDIIPMARYYGMALAPWDAVGGGRFQSKKALEERKAKGEPVRDLLGIGSELNEQETKMSEALCAVGAEHGVPDSPTTIALAYVLNKAPDVFPIVGGRKVEHLRDNIKSLSIKLTPDQMAKLEAVAPIEPGFPNIFIGEDPHVTGSAGGFLGGTAALSFTKARAPPDPK